MTSKFNPATLILLYIPWLLSIMFIGLPTISYLIAWLGSFYILYVTLLGKIKPIPEDLDIANQLMRPLFLNQIIFAGYMCCTSIFYFLDVQGYVNFEAPAPNYSVDNYLLGLVAQCQRYYCLGHAAFVSGIILFMKYPIEPTFRMERTDIARLLLVTAVITFPLAYIFELLPGLSQF
ncbi:MAG: hypothetical protein JWQ25_1494, partial [Daejeonella sp.]|nr:hypothetical protein [Daejeonella sp.]